MYNKSVLPNYTDALNAVNAALLKALIFAGSSIKGRLFQVIIVFGKNENLKVCIIVTRNLLKWMMIWKSGFLFIGHTSGVNLNQRSLGRSCIEHTRLVKQSTPFKCVPS
jgi:hypothetical protein